VSQRLPLSLFSQSLLPLLRSMVSFPTDERFSPVGRWFSRNSGCQDVAVLLKYGCGVRFGFCCSLLFLHCVLWFCLNLLCPCVLDLVFCFKFLVVFLVGCSSFLLLACLHCSCYLFLCSAFQFVLVLASPSTFGNVCVAGHPRNLATENTTKY
jgi:hypothetical protein